jgi:hypothetical protein
LRVQELLRTVVPKWIAKHKVLTKLAQELRLRDTTWRLRPMPKLLPVLVNNWPMEKNRTVSGQGTAFKVHTAYRGTITNLDKIMNRHFGLDNLPPEACPEACAMIHPALRKPGAMVNEFMPLLKKGAHLANVMGVPLVGITPAMVAKYKEAWRNNPEFQNQWNSLKKLVERGGGPAAAINDAVLARRRMTQLAVFILDLTNQ